ncbi:structural basis of auto-inhibitory mechanism of histone methyltransferase, partial [Ramicandelaber brevisporus]
MECVPSSILHRRGCGEDCLNRASFYECDPTSCPAGNECSNQPIRRGEHQISSLQVFHTGHCGYGVRAKTPILPGTFIIEYIGEVISQLEVQRRMENEYKGWQDYYFLDYEHGYVIDAGLKGNISRFINHSCDPNCIVERWIVDGRSRVGIFARRFIPPGEELSYDYNFDVFSIKDHGVAQLCYCGAATCRKTISRR